MQSGLFAISNSRFFTPCSVYHHDQRALFIDEKQPASASDRQTARADGEIIGRAKRTESCSSLRHQLRALALMAYGKRCCTPYTDSFYSKLCSELRSPMRDLNVRTLGLEAHRYTLSTVNDIHQVAVRLVRCPVI